MDRIVVVIASALGHLPHGARARLCVAVSPEASHPYGWGVVRQNEGETFLRRFLSPRPAPGQQNTANRATYKAQRRPRQMRLCLPWYSLYLYPHLSAFPSLNGSDSGRPSHPPIFPSPLESMRARPPSLRHGARLPSLCDGGAACALCPLLEDTVHSSSTATIPRPLSGQAVTLMQATGLPPAPTSSLPPLCQPCDHFSLSFIHPLPAAEPRHHPGIPFLNNTRKQTNQREARRSLSQRRRRQRAAIIQGATTESRGNTVVCASEPTHASKHARTD